MWPLMAFAIALVETATSRTSHDALQFRPNGLNNMPHSPEYEFNDFSSPEELTALQNSRYPQEEDSLDNLAAFEELEGNEFENPEQPLQPIDQMEDTQLTHLSDFLTMLLQEPGSWKAPLVLMEEPAVSGGSEERPKSEELESPPTVWKRSRYYRRYPWKRQNSRSRGAYDYDPSRYLCTPTREDVFQLLVALHDARQGNKSRTVNFCKRRRPAGAVFTNIRFLGRRK